MLFRSEVNGVWRDLGVKGLWSVMGKLSFPLSSSSASLKFAGGGLMTCRFHSKHVALRMWFFPAPCSVYERDLHGFSQKSRRWKWGRSRGGTVLLRIDHWMSAVLCMHGPICAKS